MKIVHKTVGTTLYVGLCGELDESTSVTTRAALDKLIEDFSATKFVVDMSALKFMDSTGIGVLLGRYKKLKAKGASLFIASPTPTVDKLLTLSGIYDIMPKIV
ncbi:MAG: STAS domain-containing protein [Clostridiales bacterium]|nr:STAS domain-containing protein [Clostridiales bacterium]